MNAELVKQALEKVLNPHVRVNLVSRRFRQLNADSRSLISTTGNLGVADIALLEIIALIRPAAQSRRKPQGWVKSGPVAKSKLAA
jgi:hypothetical protein